MLSLCVPSLRGHHCCMRCVAMHGVSSHCSSLPPCSEMMFQQVTLIDPSFRDHTSHAVCASISTCMCDAIQFCNLLPAGRALPAMADAAQSLLLESEPPQRKSAVRTDTAPIYHILEEVPSPPPFLSSFRCQNQTRLGLCYRNHDPRHRRGPQDHRVEEGCGAGYAIWGTLSAKQLQQVRAEKWSPPFDNAAHFGEPTASDVCSQRDRH